MVTCSIPKSEIERLKRNMISRVAALDRDLGEEVRQRALNIAGRTFDGIPPSSGDGVNAQRQKVNQYLSERVSTRIKLNKSGKNKGKFTRKGSKARQLIRANLIVNARRGKAGKSGLYGRGMASATGAFRQIAQVSVGFVKSSLIPIITTLNPLCRFKFPFNKTRNIARWPGSAGFGRTSISTTKMHPGVVMEFGANVKQGDGRVRALYDRAAGAAITAEANEIERHMKERLDKLAAKFNAEK